MQHNTIQYNTILYYAIRYDTTRHDTILHYTTLHYTIRLPVVLELVVHGHIYIYICISISISLSLYIYIYTYTYQRLRVRRPHGPAALAGATNCPPEIDDLRNHCGFSEAFSNTCSLFSGIFKNRVTFPVDVHCHLPTDFQWYVLIECHVCDF